MTSVRSLEKLYCAKCKEVMTHVAGCCAHCETPNRSSGARPTPKPIAHTTTNLAHYDARAEQAAARRRSRKARKNATSRMHA